MPHLFFIIGLLIAGGLLAASMLTGEVSVFFTAGALILGGTLAAAMASMRKKSDRMLRDLEQVWSEKLRKLEAALAEKTAAADSRDLATMVEGVAIVCRRMESRLSELESRNAASFIEAGDR